MGEYRYEGHLSPPGRKVRAMSRPAPPMPARRSSRTSTVTRSPICYRWLEEADSEDTAKRLTAVDLSVDTMSFMAAHTGLVLP
jgi:hypothetical protein